MTTVNLELSRQLQERFPEWKPGAVHSKIWARGSTTMDGHKVLPLEGDIVSRDLDELRVFALELIGEEPKHDDRRPTNKWYRWWQRQEQLKNALIKGCDPTAEWILKAFGGK